MLWRFKFSQLKGSSDDGKTRVKLLFQNIDTKQIETKVSNILIFNLVKDDIKLLSKHQKSHLMGHRYGEHITAYLFCQFFRNSTINGSNVIPIDLLHYFYKPVIKLCYDSILLFQKDSLSEVVLSTYSRYNV